MSLVVAQQSTAHTFLVASSNVDKAMSATTTFDTKASIVERLSAALASTDVSDEHEQQQERPQDDSAANVVELLTECRILAREESNRARFGAGGIHAIIAVMRRYAAMADVQIAGAKALFNISLGNPANMLEIGQTGGLEVVIQAMLAHHDNREVQLIECDLLANFASYNAEVEESGNPLMVNTNVNRDTIVTLGGVARVVAALARFGTGPANTDDANVDAEVATAACHMLWNITEGARPDTVNAVLAADGMTHLVARLQGGGRYTDHGAAACGALRNMAAAENDACREQFMRANGVQALLSSLQRATAATLATAPAEGTSSPPEKLLEVALFALTNVTFGSAERGRAAYDAGAIPIILAAMRAATYDSTVQVAGCQALNRGVLLGQSDAKLAAIAEGCFEVAQTAMATHPHSADVQGEACFCLFQLLHGSHMDEAGHSFEVDIVGLRASINIANENHPYDPIFQRTLSVLLSNTCLGEDSVGLILGPNVIRTGGYMSHR